MTTSLDTLGMAPIPISEQRTGFFPAGCNNQTAYSQEHPNKTDFGGFEKLKIRSGPTIGIAGAPRRAIGRRYGADSDGAPAADQPHDSGSKRGRTALYRHGGSDTKP
jgi:hypothetical protein